MAAIENYYMPVLKHTSSELHLDYRNLKCTELHYKQFESIKLTVTFNLLDAFFTLTWQRTLHQLKYQNETFEYHIQISSQPGQ